MLRRLLNLLPHDELRIEGELYMRRWYPLRCRWFQVRVHEIVRSDVGRHLHDHPFDFLSIGLHGGYTEVTNQVVGLILRFRTYRAPWVLFRRAEVLHRLRLLGGPTWTLVLAGPAKRDARGRALWGFATEDGFVPWWDYPIKAYSS